MKKKAKKRETKTERVLRTRMSILTSEGVSRMSRLLRRHGLDRGRLASLNEDAWLVRLADIRRNREFPWWNH